MKENTQETGMPKQPMTATATTFRSMRLLAILLLGLAVLPAQSATYKRGRPIMSSEKPGIVIEKIAWLEAKGKTETDRIQCQTQIAGGAHRQITLVFQVLDSTGKRISAFSIANSFPEYAVRLYADFRREREAKSLEIVNVVVEGKEVAYDLRIAGSRVLRSLMQPAPIPGLQPGVFGNEDSCREWLPEQGTTAASEREALADPRSDNTLVSKESDGAAAPSKMVFLKNPIVVQLSPGEQKKVCTCLAGDLLVVRYREGTCGRTAQGRKSPDEPTASIRPDLFYEIERPNSVVIQTRVPLVADTQKRPIAFSAKSKIDCFMGLKKNVLGTVAYTFWIIPAADVADFLASPAGKLLNRVDEPTSSPAFSTTPRLLP